MAGVYANTAWGAGPVTSINVNVTNSGNTTVVAGVAGRRIVLLLGDLVAANADTVTIQSSGGTILDGPLSFIANGGKIYPDTEQGHFATLVGEGLVINQVSGVQLGGHFKYATV